MTGPTGEPAPRHRPRQRKQVLLRLDPLVYEALARCWAGDELRSANAQIEFLLRRALAERAGRLPGGTGPLPAGAGRPRPPAPTPRTPSLNRDKRP
ncbi:AT hook motif protein OS=Streptomyces fumanus OX=67302 GN=GCM10018772_41340 PE=4 SV=1 [Streptomyces fumanus]